MNIIETIRNVVKAKPEIDRARAALSSAQKAEAEARAKCFDDPSPASWEGLAVAELTRHRAEAMLSEAERRARESADREAAHDRAVKLERLDALQKESAYENLPSQVEAELAIVIEGERMISDARKRILAALQKQNAARAEANALAHELGVDVRLGAASHEGNALGVVSRALARAKIARGERRGDDVCAWVKPSWAEVCE